MFSAQRFQEGGSHSPGFRTKDTILQQCVPQKTACPGISSSSSPALPECKPTGIISGHLCSLKYCYLGGVWWERRKAGLVRAVSGKGGRRGLSEQSVGGEEGGACQSSPSALLRGKIERLSLLLDTLQEVLPEPSDSPVSAKDRRMTDTL